MPSSSATCGPSSTRPRSTCCGPRISSPTHRATYDKLTDFLGLPAAPLTDARAFKANRYEPMPDDVRQRLAAYYSPLNEELFERLGCRAPWT